MGGHERELYRCHTQFHVTSQLRKVGVHGKGCAPPFPTVSPLSKETGKGLWNRESVWVNEKATGGPFPTIMLRQGNSEYHRGQRNDSEVA